MKTAFICPLYDMKNHFDLAFDLYKSKRDLGINEDMYFIFSDVPQKDKFAARIKESFSDELQYLILPEDQLHYKSKVVVKKFYALRELMNNYDYLVLIDSETRFIRKTNYSDLCEEIWDKRTCLNANVSPDGFFIMRQCFRTLSLCMYYNRMLRKEFGNFKYNIWFNEIPVYKCSTLPSFFEWFDQFDPEGWKNEWNCFEYYIYAAYLILCEGYHIRKYPEIVSNGGVMEYLFERPKEEQLNIINNLETHWSSSKDAINDRTHLLFHLDRIDGKGNYSFGLNSQHIKDLKIRRYITIIKDIVEDTYKQIISN